MIGSNLSSSHLLKALSKIILSLPFKVLYNSDVLSTYSLEIQVNKNIIIANKILKIKESLKGSKKYFIVVFLGTLRVF
jgi:hypothetical protein